MTTPVTTTPAQVEAVARALAERHLGRAVADAEWHADRPTYLREVWVREARIAVEVMSALGWQPPAAPRAADRGFGRTLGTGQ